MPLCNAMLAQILPGDPVLRSRQIWDNLQSLSTNVRILPLGEQSDRCCHGGSVALNTTEGVRRSGKQSLKRIQTGVGVENSRLETKFACTRASTLKSGRHNKRELDSRKLLTPEQFGPGLVSTSCISLEATSAVLAEKLSDVRIAVAAMRTTAGLACCVRQFSSFIALKMDMTISAR